MVQGQPVTAYVTSDNLPKITRRSSVSPMQKTQRDRVKGVRSSVLTAHSTMSRRSLAVKTRKSDCLPLLKLYRYSSLCTSLFIARTKLSDSLFCPFYARIADSVLKQSKHPSHPPSIALTTMREPAQVQVRAVPTRPLSASNHHHHHHNNTTISTTGSCRRRSVLAQVSLLIWPARKLLRLQL